MYNQTTSWIPLLRTSFVCQQIAFCSFVATWLCYYSLGSWLIFKDPFKSRHRVHGEGDIQFFNPFSLYCFTLLDEDYVFLFYFYPQLAVFPGKKRTLVSLLHQSPKFYYNVFLFVGLTNSKTSFEFYLLAHLVECPNVSSNNCNLHKG